MGNRGGHQYACATTVREIAEDDHQYPDHANDFVSLATRYSENSTLPAKTKTNITSSCPARYFRITSSESKTKKTVNGMKHS